MLYLLFRLVPRARPFCDDIFFGFGIRCKRKSDSGERSPLQSM